MKKPAYLLALLLLAPNAYAYLDPGSGMGILQVLIAAAAGVAYSIKLYWRRLKLFFSNLFNRPPGDNN